MSISGKNIFYIMGLTTYNDLVQKDLRNVFSGQKAGYSQCVL